MAQNATQDPNELHATLQRHQRALVRQQQEVQYAAQLQVPQSLPELRTHIRYIEVRCRLLREEIGKFETELVKYERLTVAVTDPNLVQQRDQWGDLLHSTLQVVTEGEVLLQDLNKIVSAATAPPPPASQAQAPQGTVDGNLSRLLDLIERQEQRNSTPTSATAGPTNPSPTKTTRLPKLELIKFSGDIMKWRQFWDRFQASVDSNPHIAAVDKMNYLIGLLEGEALTHVETLPLTNASYPLAVDTLKKHYDDEKLLVGRLHRRLNEMKPVSADPPALRKFVAEIDSLMGTLSALGQQISDASFVSLILSKIPEQTVMFLEMGKPVDTDWTVSLVREKMTEHLIRLERSSQISAGSSSSKKGLGLTTDSFHAGASGAAKGPTKKEKSQKGKGPKKGQTEPRSRPIPSCTFCEQEHYSDKCSKFPDFDSRFKVIKGKRCYNCLSPDHIKPNCTNPRPCYYCKQVQKHHSSLCKEKFGSIKKGMGKKGGPDSSHVTTDGDKKAGQSPDADTSDSESGLLAAGEEVLLQTVLILVQDATQPSAKPKKIRALLDSASSRSYCSQELSQRLKLKTHKGRDLLVNRFGAPKPKTVPTKEAKVALHKLDGSLAEVEVSVVNTVSGSLTRAPVQVEKLGRYTKSLRMADTVPTERESGPVHLLIGNDHYFEFISGQRIQVSDGLFLVESVFGWILTGRVPQLRQDDYPMSMAAFSCFASTTLAEVSAHPVGDTPVGNPEMVDFWSLQTLGITDDPNETDDDKAVRDFKKHVSFKNGRYSVSLPFNENVTDLQSDYNLSLGRLNSQLKKLEDEPALRDSYAQILKGQLEKRVIEKVEAVTKPQGSVHYIPHHAVVKPERETTKVRMVFDGSAKTKKHSPSLNECLFRGPILLEDLVGLLLRFRLHPVAVIADIEKAFLQIGIREEDRDFTRFLWLKDPTKPASMDNIQEYRFTRVPFGLNCSPSLLAQTVAHHLELDGSSTARQLQSNLYVDNVITGAQTVSEAQTLYVESKVIFKRASMNLRAWCSNTPEFLDTIPPEDRLTGETVKVLGVNWSTTADTLSVQPVSGQKLDNVATKRQLLSALSSVFDPLGLFSPCTVKGKCLLQKVIQDKKSWDSPMSRDRVEQWKTESVSVAAVGTVQIPRHIPNSGILMLIAFCDASASSFATCIFLRADENGAVSVNLLFSKSRLNPAQKLTIPKLELMGMLIGKRALKFTLNHIWLPISQMFLLSDSQVALSWVKEPKGSDLFVKNRVKEIQSMGGITARYVHTDQNPADWATRGKDPSELNEFWWNGPCFLKTQLSDWPNWEFPPFKVAPSLPSTSPEVSFLTPDAPVPVPPFGIDPKKHSTLLKLQRVTAWCQRFIANLKSASKAKRCLSAEEIAKTKCLWDLHVQSLAYPKVKDAIKAGRRHDMIDMGVFFDHDGVLRVKGRLANSAMQWPHKYPKLLPKKHPYTHLLALSAHAKSGHGSVVHSLTMLRSEYWVPKGRSLIQSVTSRCVTCKKAIGKPYGIPDMPELPPSRVVPQACFTHTGVDYFGPLKVRNGDTTTKCWVALFTCLNSRAIHLELVMDLSAGEFLLAFERFISRRGKPSRMLCDNGPQFKLVGTVTEKTWQKVFGSNEVSNFCANSGISWTFIPAFAPYMGGVYERMVGIVKTSLRKTISPSLLSVKQLETALCKCEATVNGRPLLPFGDDLSPAGILTPNHFLTLNPKTIVGDQGVIGKDTSPFPTQSATADDLLQEWKKGQRLLNEFWKVWSSEYLDHLRERSQYRHKHNSRSPLKPEVGHVVLLKGQGLPRGSWKLARITQVYESSDGAIRSVIIRLPSGRELRRPVSLLIPLEVSPASNANQGQAPDAEPDTGSVDNDQRSSSPEF